MSMSNGIYDELRLFVDSVLAGCIFAMAYDVLIIIRKVFSHSSIVTGLEDALYWVFTSIAAFLILYELNAGVVRWFFIVGAALGMFLYKESISIFIINIMSTILTYLVKFIKLVAHVVAFPIKWLCFGIGKLLKILKKCFFFVKNKLTVCIKLFKIALCKQKDTE